MKNTIYTAFGGTQYSISPLEKYELRICVNITFYDIGEIPVQFYTTEEDYETAYHLLCELMVANSKIKIFEFHSHYTEREDKRIDDLLDEFLHRI